MKTTCSRCCAFRMRLPWGEGCDLFRARSPRRPVSPSPCPSLDRVACERILEDDDAGGDVGGLDLVRAGEDVFGLEAVESLVEVVVRVNDAALEFESGEESTAAGGGGDAGVELAVGGGGCGESD